MAGYSGTPLLKKLGYQPGDSIYLQAAPVWFKKQLQDNGIKATIHLPADWVHAFFTWKLDLEMFLHKIDLHDIKKGLWVSWPKQAAKVETNLTEQAFRDHILPMDWVDIKVAAIDDTWSGLKFTRRKA